MPKKKATTIISAEEMARRITKYIDDKYNGNRFKAAIDFGCSDTLVHLVISGKRTPPEKMWRAVGGTKRYKQIINEYEV